ncbi:MAG: thiamine-phosphate kinase [Ghiorsea sp.]|nr:thiamine-phosphate kinase [Ghiorsea sp.]
MNQEFEAIAQLFQTRTPFRHPTTSLGNGDDASVHHIPEGMELVVSTDIAVEGVHWPQDMRLDIAGSRAVNAALSDLAAMGAVPAWIWLAISAKDKQSLAQMSDGIVQTCLTHNVELAGGDTVSAPINSINVTVGGLLSKDTAMTRSAAKVNDEAWILGDSGLSAAGLKQWLSGQQHGSFVPHFQMITPLYKQGAALRELGIQSCIDISDGLLQDLGHISKASQVCIQIDINLVKQLDSYQQLQAVFNTEETLKMMLSGGEDFALCFTAPATKYTSLIELGAKHIGFCCKGNGVQLMQGEKIIDYNIKGYDHFG